jgi:molybdenum cofactor biosynthesis protein A
MLIDNHGRPVNYLRLAVTDRCNLRCLYCMPAGGLDWVPRGELLTFEEIMRLLRVASSLGVTKLRLTGGEPFLRKDLMTLIREIHDEQLFSHVTLTTNGTLTLPHVGELKQHGIHSVNLSADTFNPERFLRMTRRTELQPVLDTFHALLENGIEVKVNAVIMEEKNEEDLREMAALTLTYPVSVRFIEEMPFNGAGDSHAIKWNWKTMRDELASHFPGLEKLADEPHSTSLNYRIPGALGTVGLIPAYTRSFCGSCNRIRITPQGTLKTCLYDHGVRDLRGLIRSGADDEAIADAISHAVARRPADGREAELLRKQFPVAESMATIGG